MSAEPCTVMHCMSTRFGVDSSSSFSFTVTDATESYHPTCASATAGVGRGVATGGGYIGIYTPRPKKNQSTLQIFTSCFVHMWDINMF